MSAARRRVLVVEDDAATLGFVTALLADEGYDVRAAPDGRAGLDVLDAWIPDVIVLDLAMPRVDGAAFRVAQLARPAARAVPVVVTSATHASDVKARAAALGAAAAFPKPFALEPFLAAVRRLAGGG